MQLLKPAWVTHDGHPIFSVDFHPDGSRFATGGQGADTGRIVIWNMAPVMNEEDEQDETVPKLLCQLDNHLACVNCVRWSVSGKFLASGGDDKVIMVWQSARYGNGSSGFGGSVNTEHWRCIASLRGHTGDILDLAWSPHDVWLASCSVDNSVIIWNTNKWQEITAVLKGHTGLVKGVSWDPVGRYMASQSDDKSLRIWRTHDWQPETVVTEPFVECGGTTHTLRLSWSPDGQYLVSAHAMNNSGPTAQIIERDGWKTNKDFVGHRKAITCVRFNPSILSKVNKETGKAQNFCCCAIGSRDRSLSVWLTCLKRPLVVVHDLFSNSVLDISWSVTGYQLLVCSWDGSVAFLNFSPEEIGKPISSEDRSQLHQRLYGKSLSNHTNSAIIENPELLKLQEEHKKRQENQSTLFQNGRSCESNRLLVKGPTDKQIETRMPDGRRRITPLFIPVLPDGGDAPVPFNSRAVPTFSSSCEGKSKIVIEKRDESNMSQQSFSAKQCGANSSEAGVSNHASNAASSDTPTTKVAQNKETTLVIKEEVTPTSESAVTVTESLVVTTAAIASTTTVSTTTTSMTVSTTASTVAVTSTNAAVVTTTATTTTAAAAATTATTTTPSPSVNSTNAAMKDANRLKAAPVSSVSVDSVPIQVPHKKRTSTEVPVRTPVEKRKPGRPPLSQTLHSTPEKEPRQERISSGVGSGNVGHGASLHLPVLRVEKTASVQVPVSSGELEAVVEVENNVTAGPGSTVHCLRHLVSGQPTWQVLLDSRGAGVAASSSLACVVCEDSTLSIFSMGSGQRLRPAVVLSSPPTRLTCNGSRVMVITSRGNINVWDMRSMQCTVKNESLLPIMQAGGQDLSIRSTGLTDGGNPLVSLSTGKAFVFDSQLSSWLLVSSADSVLHQGCWYLGSAPKGDSKSLPLATLQGQVTRNQRLSMSGNRGAFGGSLQQAGCLSHLDGQVAAALSLHSATEYRHWLVALAKFLTQEGLEDRVRELCDSLLGPPTNPGGGTGNWQPYILGIHRHDLLKEILPLVASNLRLQRLFVQYKEQLDLLS